MRKFIITFAVLIINMSFVLAQSSQTCTAIVEEALAQMGTNCANLGVNNACYGHLGVIADFSAGADVTFQQPADRATLNQLEHIETAALNEVTGEWGISVLRLTANVPNSLPGQGVVFIMMGDAELDNEVTSENAYNAETSVSVEIANDSASLLSFPPAWGNRSSVEVGTLASGETIDADAVSEDGEWVRVAYVSERSETSKLGSAWINIDDVVETDLSELAIINAESRSPMQVFTLQTGFGQPSCVEQPESQLFIQGPQTIEVDLTANGIDFRLTSSMSLTVFQNPDGTITARFIPVTGAVTLPAPNDPDNPNAAIRINASQFIEMPLIRDPNTQELVIDPAWIANFASNKEVFDQATQDGTNYISPADVVSLGTLQNLPTNLLNYTLDERTPIIIRPSGAGNPIPEFGTFTPDNDE